MQRLVIILCALLMCGCNIGFDSQPIQPVDGDTATGDLSGDNDVSIDGDVSVDMLPDGDPRLDVLDAEDLTGDTRNDAESDTPVGDMGNADVGPMWMPNLAPQGFGAVAQGGAAEVTVTSLADSGPGTLREALESGGNRRVVFGVTGEIQLASAIIVTDDNITLDGSTAPGGGVMVSGEALRLRGSDIIVRYMRFRPGASGTAGLAAGVDGIRFDPGAQRILIDHCSFAWTIDESISLLADTGPVLNITVQYSILAESLSSCSAIGSCLGGGLIAFGDTRRISIHHNVFVSNFGMNPTLTDQEFNFQVINNIVHDYGEGVIIDPKGSNAQVDVIGNVFTSPAVPGSFEVMGRDAATATNIFLYVDDVLGPNRQGVEPDEAVVSPELRSSLRPNPTATPLTPVQIDPPELLASWLLDEVGATLPCRDRVDARILDKVRNQQTGFVTDPSQFNANDNLSCN